MTRSTPSKIKKHVRTALDLARGEDSWRTFAEALSVHARKRTITGAGVHLWYKSGRIPSYWVHLIIAKYPSVATRFGPGDLHEDFREVATSLAANG